MKRFLLSAAICSLSLSGFADLVLHYPMNPDNKVGITDAIGGSAMKYSGNFAPETIEGPEGSALRFDGYTTYLTGDCGLPENMETITISMWVAPETFPIIKHDVPTDDKVLIAGNLDRISKKGWGITLGKTGKYAFEGFAAGWSFKAESSDLMECGKWNNITATADKAAKKIFLYRNGFKVGEGKISGDVSNSSRFFMGKDAENEFFDCFLVNTFNGALGDVRVYDTVMPESEIAELKTTLEPNLSVPASRFETDLLRPKFHGMPAGGWTNESHGLTYSNGRWHVFFQKNANGPYMSRLHWGHISSPDLTNWTEEKIAIAPDSPYDIKGCWSGAVFKDPVLGDGMTSMIYTGVDYGKAVIALASAEDENLLNWNKAEYNPLIDGRPSGLSDDFRDPYFFRDGDNAYIIVGSSKDNVGVATLHKYNPSANSFSNDGKLFFKGVSKASDGRFWEMPSVTKMTNGKWLFTCTPLETGQGVRTLYRTGSINSDGTFNADSSNPSLVELIAKEGYGLLSPSICQKEGRTIALGIVPDKLPGGDNALLGWAHCYSFPREWSLNEKNELLQKPAEELRNLRSQTLFSKADFELNGELDLDPVSGRQVEVEAVYELGTSEIGVNLLQGNGGQARLSYKPGARQFTVDLTSLDRKENDGWSFKGKYQATLPGSIPAGSEFKLNVFLDGSILDIFINDRWATSIRVFPTDKDSNGVSAFSNGSAKVKSLKAWNLEAGESTGAVEIFPEEVSNGKVNVHTISGILLKEKVDPSEAAAGLSPGIYIIGNKKIIVR